MPLNILQYTGHHPTPKNYLAPNVHHAKVEQSWASKKAGCKFQLSFIAV